jgi:hypothetical protein
METSDGHHPIIHKYRKRRRIVDLAIIFWLCIGAVILILAFRIEREGSRTPSTLLKPQPVVETLEPGTSDFPDGIAVVDSRAPSEVLPSGFSNVGENENFSDDLPEVQQGGLDPAGAVSLVTPDSPIAEFSAGTSSGTEQYTDYDEDRYENSRLGFVFALPRILTVESESATGMIISNKRSGDVPYLTDGDIRITVERTGTCMTVGDRPLYDNYSFRSCGFCSEGAPPSDWVEPEVKELCVPPFLITLEASARDPIRGFEMKLFLNNVARTLYPIVEPFPPYRTIR